VARHDDEVEIASLGGCAQSADQLSDLLVVVNQLDIIEADEVVLPAQQIQQIVAELFECERFVAPGRLL